MHTITKLSLDNDLDLILAHKRSMQVAELGGVGLVNQTSFATAVSEISRLVLDKGKNPCIYLGFSQGQTGNRVFAKIVDDFITELDAENPNLNYAKRLVQAFNIDTDIITLFCDLPVGSRISKDMINRGRKLFEELPPVTPYEQAKQLNVQLQQMADRLAESEQKYQTLTDSLPLMMFTINKSGQFLYANGGFKNFAGLSEEVTRETNFLKWLSANSSNLSKTDLASKLDIGNPFSLETAITDSKSGEERWHLLSMTPSDTKEDQWSGFLVDIHAQKVIAQTLRDNEELRQTKLILEERQKELDATIIDLNKSNQELEKFAYVASHDLQEPARKMVVLSDIMLQKASEVLPAESTNILVRIKSASERMLSVIRDLLDYSRLTTDQEIVMEEMEFSDVIFSVKENLESQIRETHAEIKLENSIPFLANRHLIILLLQNLVSNSIKFTREDQKPIVSINIQQISESEKQEHDLPNDHSWIRLQVRDNGIGFEVKYLEKIFQMFQRLHNQDQFKGTGIGLAICKRIVEIHKGVIVVKSEIDKGSAFSVYLPMGVRK